jgi:hypothetical protein
LVGKPAAAMARDNNSSSISILVLIVDSPPMCMIFPLYTHMLFGTRLVTDHDKEAG